MFFVFVVFPAGVGVIKATSRAVSAYRNRKAWKKEACELPKTHGDEKRHLCTLDLMLTPSEAEMFENTPAAEFLAERQISKKAAAHLKGRRSDE